MASKKPLILVTNDDGIDSPGLRAAVQAVAHLGDILIVAPKIQQSGAARSFPMKEGDSEQVSWPVKGPHQIIAYRTDGSPAQAVRRAVLLFAPRKPVLVVSGINYGENLGAGITISGTVGAALEAASFGIPSLAVSLQTYLDQHLSNSHEVDFSAARFFTRQFAESVLRQPLPPDVDILKIEVPQGATEETPWRITRVSRSQYFHSIVKEENGKRLIDGYEPRIEEGLLEPDSDVKALAIDRVVSVSPLSIDLTSAVDRQYLRMMFEAR
ncbi:MAG: 5'/3'-nucleotidase SurE [Chloroflexi bacterium]|nr:5'/3'-nucleotidase SurE [Chloroflexota bacterium]